MVVFKTVKVRDRLYRPQRRRCGGWENHLYIVSEVGDYFFKAQVNGRTITVGEMRAKSLRRSPKK